jgi:ferritin-like metal-binding protein YciE
MASIDSLRTLLVEELQDIYDADKRLTKAIPKLIKKSTHGELKTALQNHLGETEEHVARIEQAFEYLDTPAKSKPCPGMKGLIEEGDEHLSEDYDDDGLRDAAIIGSAQRVEHYEIAAYGTAIAHARLLELDDVVSVLEETLDEEKAADQKLTDIAESVVNLDAASEDEEQEGASKPPSGKQPRGAGGMAMMGRGTGSRSSAADRGGRSSKRSTRR